MGGLEKLRRFATSPHHAWLALLTLGPGVASATALGAVVGLAAYALGWVHLPDSPWFRKWISRRETEQGWEREEQFLEMRRSMYQELNDDSRSQYLDLVSMIEELERSLARHHGKTSEPVTDAPSQLRELAWTYLRLLHTRDSLARFLGNTDPEATEREIAVLEQELAELEPGALRLAESKRAHLATLRSRIERETEISNNLRLAEAELERLADLVKLHRAEHYATRDTQGYQGLEISNASYRSTVDWLQGLEAGTGRRSQFDDATAAGVGLRVSE